MNATPGAVRDVLTGDHESWDPHIESIVGELKPGVKLAVRFRNGMTFKPTVTVAEPGQKLEWLGRGGFGIPLDIDQSFEVMLNSILPGR